MSRDLPVEEDILYPWSLADVVHDHVSAIGSFLIDHDADVRDVAT
jgi:hypothetical protein